MNIIVNQYPGNYQFDVSPLLHIENLMKGVEGTKSDGNIEYSSYEVNKQAIKYLSGTVPMKIKETELGATIAQICHVLTKQMWTSFKPSTYFHKALAATDAVDSLDQTEKLLEEIANSESFLKTTERVGVDVYKKTQEGKNTYKLVRKIDRSWTSMVE